MSRYSGHSFAGAAVAQNRLRLLVLALLLVEATCTLPLIAQTEPSNAAQAIVRIEINLRGPAYAPLHGQVSLHEVDGSASHVLALDGPIISTSLPPDSAWEISASLPGYWCRRESIRLGPAGSTTSQSIDTWPLGTISGSLPELAVLPS